jgi:hypothetical protein
MVLVTATDVKNAARTYHVGILLQSDDDLEDLITLCQSDLERRTGHIFEGDREVVERVIGHNSKVIQLGHYPLTSIDEVLIDNAEYTLDSDEYELGTGTIILTSPPSDLDYTYQVTYTTAARPEEPIAKDVLCRMVLDKVKNRASTVEDDINRLSRVIMEVI